MNILIACEESGIVRNAFIKKGHNAVSCDIIDTSSEGPHIKNDIYNIDLSKYDLLIGHPPCTYLCASGERWFTSTPKYKLNPNIKYGLDRYPALDEAIKLFLYLYNAPVKKIALENPKMNLLARVKLREFKLNKPTQFINPYEFGHLESKNTGLWLKNLNPLKPTNNVYHEMMKLPKKERQKIHYYNGPISDRAKIRSKTYLGIAEAMAEQWG